jgi:hypothetical protein
MLMGSIDLETSSDSILCVEIGLRAVSIAD